MLSIHVDSCLSAHALRFFFAGFAGVGSNGSGSGSHDANAWQVLWPQ